MKEISAHRQPAAIRSDEAWQGDRACHDHWPEHANGRLGRACDSPSALSSAQGEPMVSEKAAQREMISSTRWGTCTSLKRDFKGFCIFH